MVTPVHRFQSIESVMGGSLEMVATAQNPTTRTRASPTSKLKCGVWIFFALVTFFLAGSKYYFHGINIGVEALVFCTLLVVVLIVGGLVSLCEAMFFYAPANNRATSSVQVTDQSDNQETHNNSVPTTAAVNNAEMPPPPYHIAVMLSPQNEDMDTIHVIRDSPPPSYEKVFSNSTNSPINRQKENANFATVFNRTHPVPT
ncbi:unnamed protein product [Callosobruchus maculatus]|uniref:Uncharacterized protein n=1 Tax=Callosobruchus maculatus TaxID=64391 RepID=A0A653CZS8_CALMS|nr:unnamed protein product [Callosobruchus maculatus]